MFILFLSLCLTLAAPANVIDHEQLVEACCCPKSQVDATFHEMLGKLNLLVQQPYFRYYRANLEKECPYWAVELMCGMAADGRPPPCHVCTCDDHEVPMALRHEDICGTMSQSRENGAEENQVPINVDRTLPTPMGVWEDTTSLWFNDETDDPHAVYIDLMRNPEANTGYAGDGARRVWSAVYNENCFQGPLADMCVAERAFYRILSGLHVSISTQISRRFYLKPGGSPDGSDEWDPNLEMFMRTVGQWPDRIDNLYFLYMFALRALHKAKPFLLSLEFRTDDEQGDQQTRQQMADVLEARLVCTHTFNESLMFSGLQDKEVILRQMRNHFFNISRLMDCLSCEKCRLWGKLQIHGLSTALRIVVEDTTVDSLTRSDIVALIQVIRQLSSSISSVQLLLAQWRAGHGGKDATGHFLNPFA